MNFRPLAIQATEIYAVMHAERLRREYAPFFLALTPEDDERACNLLLDILAYFERQDLQPKYHDGLLSRVATNRTHANLGEPFGVCAPELTRYVAWRIKFQHDNDAELFISYVSVIEELYIQLKQQQRGSTSDKETTQEELTMLRDEYFRSRKEMLRELEAARVIKERRRKLEAIRDIKERRRHSQEKMRASHARLVKAGRQRVERARTQAAHEREKVRIRKKAQAQKRAEAERRAAAVEGDMIPIRQALREYGWAEPRPSLKEHNHSDSFGKWIQPLPTLAELDSAEWAPLEDLDELPIWTPEVKEKLLPPGSEETEHGFTLRDTTLKFLQQTKYQKKPLRHEKRSRLDARRIEIVRLSILNKNKVKDRASNG